MQVEVTHTTRYRYQPPVDNAKHVAYLTPTATGFQQVLSHSLQVNPQPEECESRVDMYGNICTFFSISKAHPMLCVTARSIVVTLPRPVVTSTVPWEAVHDQLRYRAHAPYHSAAEFVFASPCVPRHADFAHYALPSFSPGASLPDCAAHLMGRIHTDFTYETHSTQVNTPTLQALAQRRGVCQDFAHIMVACWRAMGLPARYVSGYVLTQPPEGQARLVGCDASHAWASVFIPSAGQTNATAQIDGQWLDFDPTNNRSPDEDYVVLATGRDFADVSPLRGVILGGADHQLEVEVTVMPQ
jgi:transglutaminase-like putative cysteine protease